MQLREEHCNPDERKDAPESRSDNPAGLSDTQAPTVAGVPPDSDDFPLLYQAGTTVSHYEIRAPLGRGGMGEVYEGFDLTLRRAVALKAIRAERRLHTRARLRFLREARILSRLDHPHICRIYDYVEGDGSDFIVLELIDGEVLSDVLERGLDKTRKMEIAEQIVEVLAAAHAVGVVHRDLKPGNVMLTAGDGVKVLDFGLASSPERDPAPGEEPEESVPGSDGGPDPVFETPLMTEAGTLMGTVAYMSPEQARTEKPLAASDMYSFGILLQELMTQRPAYPRDAGPVALLQMVRRGETLPPTGVPRDLAGLIERLTSLAPSNRPTAVEAAERLRRIREKPKRVARRLAVAAVLAAVALAGMKYTVDLRRERTIADQRRHQAEDLVKFMLGDLRTKLEPIGKLEILDDVGNKAMEYFAAVPERDLSDDERLSRSMALSQIGEVRLLQNNADLSAALTAFQESLTLSRALVAARPDSVDRRFRLSQSEFWVGYVHWQRNQLDDALTHFRSYLEIARWLVSKEPDNPQWQLELSYANSNIGSVLDARGEPDAALEKYLETLRINKALVDRDPSNREWMQQLAEQYNLVGSAELQLGDLDGALENFRSDLELKKELTAADPDNSEWIDGLANGHNWVAQVLAARGRAVEARAHFTQDLDLTSHLVERDPTNTRNQYNLGRTRQALARLDISLGRNDDAVAEARSSLRVISKLSAQDPSNESWRLNHAASGTVLARALLARGDHTEAGKVLRSALAGLKLPPDGAAGPAELIVVAETLSVLAGLETPRTGGGSFLQVWRPTIDVLERAGSVSRDPRLLDPWVRLLVLTDRTKEADTVRQRLEKIGYRNLDYVKFMRRHPLPADGS